MKIQLPELDVIVGNNGFWTGLVLKQHLTFDEAYYIAESALGINMDLISDDWRARREEEDDDVSDEIDDFTSDVEGLLTGQNTWDAFTDRWTCGDGLEDICPMMFLQMLYVANYLHLL